MKKSVICGSTIYTVDIKETKREKRIKAWEGTWSWHICRYILWAFLLPIALLNSLRKPPEIGLLVAVSAGALLTSVYA